MLCFTDSSRAVLAVTGADRVVFLQGLITADAAQTSPFYAAMLTPTGKFLHDFFVFPTMDALLLTPEASRANALAQRLSLFKLRAAVEINHEQALCLVRCLDIAPAGFVADPRGAGLGSIALLPAEQAPPFTQAGSDAYHQARIQHGLPDAALDLIPERSLPLEVNLDRANAISFSKGCYMGQELTARTHYRQLIKKRLAPVHGAAPLPPVDTPLLHEGVEVGVMRGHLKHQGLALLALEWHQDGAKLVSSDGAHLTVQHQRGGL
jgi:tRNA-modifying protein YgfZ